MKLKREREREKERAAESKIKLYLNDFTFHGEIKFNLEFLASFTLFLFLTP